MELILRKTLFGWVYPGCKRSTAFLRLLVGHACCHWQRKVRFAIATAEFQTICDTRSRGRKRINTLWDLCRASRAPPGTVQLTKESRVGRKNTNVPTKGAADERFSIRVKIRAHGAIFRKTTRNPSKNYIPQFFDLSSLDSSTSLVPSQPNYISIDFTLFPMQLLKIYITYQVKQKTWSFETLLPNCFLISSLILTK